MAVADAYAKVYITKAVTYSVPLLPGYNNKGQLPFLDSVAYATVRHEQPVSASLGKVTDILK